MPRKSDAYAPRLSFVFGLHVLIYYCLSNVVPALVPEIRTELLQARIPASDAWAYSLASVAACLMLTGLAAGCGITSLLWPRSDSPAPRQFPWLPNYDLAVRSCLVILALIAAGTILFGVQVGSETFLDEEIAQLAIHRKLIFHGLFTVLTIAPLLAAAAYARAVLPSQMRSSLWLMVISCTLTLAVLLIWGQRSTAMLSLMLPIWLLVHAGKLQWRRAVVPSIGLILAVYFAVTVVRDSYLLPLLALTDDIGGLTVDEVVSAVRTRKNEDGGVMTRAVADLSYRTAGLEGVAAIIQAQTEGRLPLQLGKTLVTGLQNAFPSPLRVGVDIEKRIKTAPASFGVFRPGDWVTTILAEYVLDFGLFLLFFPSLVTGIALSLIDRTLFELGQRPVLEGLLILRIVFLLFIISNGGSFAEMTLLLFKATIGYTAVFLILGALLVKKIEHSRTAVLLTK